ncbi:ribosomal protein S16 [Aureobasidium namibiae CBS 147.97]|uniref:Ribosomal protein S16 n=1 Tax=Aureobasidium namibiae CBS 147.97 TaxID=1043004 RepID=A0A074X052_9PEZI|nr:ribosomal protein S16 [Aureobasidium namibiae CBS 147.97]KEQ77094.1 ribosomal protein S16 [Aureobasidium namibiae CBS 147.97]
MVLKIRLARFGKRHAPFYNIVVAHARTARGSKPLEVLGTYDPIPKTPTDGNETAKKFKDIKLDIHRAKYWLGVGAQPSEPAWRLLSMVSSVPPADDENTEEKKIRAMRIRKRRRYEHRVARTLEETIKKGNDPGKSIC